MTPGTPRGARRAHSKILTPTFQGAAKDIGPDSQIAVYGADPGSTLYGELPVPLGTFLIVR